RENFLGDQYLGPQIQLAIVNAVRAIAGDNARASAYADDLRLRHDFQRSATVVSFIELIDSWVGLSPQQMQRMTVVVEELYKRGHLSFSPAMSMQDFGPKEKLAPILKLLTEQQRVYFNKFGNEDPSGRFALSEELEEDGAKQAALKVQLQSVAAMKIECLRIRLGLTPRQVRRLQLVSKKVVSTSLRLRTDTKRAYMKSATDRADGRPVALDQNRMAIMTAHPVHLFETQTDWDKFVVAALTDDQKLLQAESVKATVERKRDVLGYMLVMAFQRELKLSGKQMHATHKLISPGFGAVRSVAMNGVNMMDNFASLLDISDEKYVEAMGADNWAVFEPQLQQLRMQLERMKKAKED
ncbi:MAG: hypothetical protein AB8G99_25915, partial [Planctomycetaceae bacterium]